MKLVAVLFTLKDRLVAMEMFAAFKLVVQTMTAFNLALVAISLALTREIQSPQRAIA